MTSENLFEILVGSRLILKARILKVPASEHPPSSSPSVSFPSVFVGSQQQWYQPYFSPVLERHLKPFQGLTCSLQEESTYSSVYPYCEGPQLASSGRICIYPEYGYCFHNESTCYPSQLSVCQGMDIVSVCFPGCWIVDSDLFLSEGFLLLLHSFVHSWP